MKKLLYILLLTLFLPVPMSAQKQITLQEKNIRKEGSNIVVEYNISMETYDWCEIAIYISIDGGKTFYPNPLRSVTGDVGKITSSGEKKITWVVGNTINSYAGQDISFKINVEKFKRSKKAEKEERLAAQKAEDDKLAAQKVEQQKLLAQKAADQKAAELKAAHDAAKKTTTTNVPTGTKDNVSVKKEKAAPKKAPAERKSATFVMAAVGIGSPLSYGLMAGWSSPKAGFYVKAKSNFNFTSPTLTVDETGKLEDGSGYIFATGNTAASSLAITAGVLLPLYKVIYLNIGIGYGAIANSWETSSGDWAKISSASASGLAADLGLIFKINKLAISVGASYVMPTAIGAEVGIGIAF